MREKQLKAKLARIEEAEQVEIYANRLKTETLKSFKDVPDEIKSINILKVTNNLAQIEWPVPESNNSEITHYNLYLS